MVKCPYADCNFTHEFWVDMREYIWNLDQSDVQWVLPRILEVLIDDTDRLYLEMVIQRLDALQYVSEESLNHFEDKYGKDAADQRRQLYVRWRTEAQLLFSSFTKEQACAIYKWLKMIQSWDEYLFFEEMVDSAIAYWSARCADASPEHPNAG